MLLYGWGVLQCHNAFIKNFVKIRPMIFPFMEGEYAKDWSFHGWNFNLST